MIPPTVDTSSRKQWASNEFGKSFVKDPQFPENFTPNTRQLPLAPQPLPQARTQVEKSAEKSATDLLKYRVESVSGRDCIVLDEIDVEPSPSPPASPIQQSSCSADTAASQPPPIKKPRNKK